MAIVTPEEAQVLMRMGYAEYIIPAMNQSVAERAIAEYRDSDGAAASGVAPGQAGGIVFGEIAGEPGYLDILGEFRLSDVSERLPSVPTIQRAMIGAAVLCALIVAVRLAR